MKFLTIVLALLAAGNGDNVKLIARPMQVMWGYKPYKVTLTVYVGAPTGRYQGLCVMWGDGGKTCRDIPIEDADRWTLTVQHTYTMCAPEVPINVVFGAIEYTLRWDDETFKTQYPKEALKKLEDLKAQGIEPEITAEGYKQAKVVTKGIRVIGCD